MLKNKTKRNKKQQQKQKKQKQKQKKNKKKKKENRNLLAVGFPFSVETAELIIQNVILITLQGHKVRPV